MELRKQNQRKKPGQVTAASCWCKMVYIKWVISSLLYIWLWKYESFSAWDSSMCFFFCASHLHQDQWSPFGSHWKGWYQSLWSAVCVCVLDVMSAAYWDSEKPDSFCRPIKVYIGLNHVRPVVILIDSTCLLFRCLVYKGICWIRGLIHLAQHPSLYYSGKSKINIRLR